MRSLAGRPCPRSPSRMQTELEAARLRERLSGFAGRRVLAIGDLMLDEFIWGKVSRISPEAPVPVVQVVGESYYPGGAANVARTLREFTPSVTIMGVTGADAHGQQLLRLLEASGIDIAGVQQETEFPTTVKTRIIARHQQVVRVDRERPHALTEEQTRWAMAALDRLAGGVDAIIVADYGKGFLTQPLADYICRAAESRGRILTID